MSDSFTPPGFGLTRRGYAVDQVDRALAELTRARDAAWERVGRLSAEVRELEQQIERARAAAEQAPEPSFGQLSERAAHILDMVESEGKAIRAEALAEAERFAEEARAAAKRIAEGAAEAAGQVRGRADDDHRREVERARAA